MTLSGISSAGSIATVLQTASQSSSTQSTASSSSPPNAPFIQKKNEDASVSRLRAAAEDYLKTLNLINQISKNSENSETNDIFEALGIGTSSSETEDGLNNAAGKLAQKVVNGTDGNDFIRGIEGGKATINAGAGNDFITAEGDLQVDAGSGDDFVTVRGQAVVDGGSGNDRIVTHGQSHIHGGSGRDFISTYGQATIYGGSGNDGINAQGQAVIYGGAGDDSINVHGKATVDGGAGDDHILIKGSDTTLTFGKGSGRDSVSLQGNVKIEIGAEFSIDDIELSQNGPLTTISFNGAEEKVGIFAKASDLTATLKFSDGQTLDISLDYNTEDLQSIDTRFIKGPGKSQQIPSPITIDKTV